MLPYLGFRFLRLACLLTASLLLTFPQAGLSQEQPPRRPRIQASEKQTDPIRKEVDTPLSPGDSAFRPEWLRTLSWRSIGPANMGGRIIDISVYEADPTTYWIATASGGLLKTTNNGVTFEHQFDREATVSLGAVCVAQSDPKIVWVGTGEYSPRNSVSYGNGVYKSTDGGKTWKNMGLQKSFQIGKLVVHPKNPNIVYVGALGRLYGPNEERGLYKTTDGGQNWEKILYVDDKTGVIDIAMHPTDPETLLVATYERQRDEFDGNDPAKKWGPGAGIYKTTDGGKTFKKLVDGLPTCQLGRIGLCYFRKDPNIVFAIIETEKIGMGTPPPPPAYLGVVSEEAEDVGGVKIAQLTPGGPAEKAGLKVGDLIVDLAGNAVKNRDELTAALAKFKAGDKVKLKVRRDGKEVEIELTFGTVPAQPGGRAGGPGMIGGRGAVDPKRPYAANLGGQRENVQDQQGPNGHEYGGVYKSSDGGETWTRINSVNPRPMYFSVIRVDPNDVNLLYVLGVALYRSRDGGKTFRADARGFHADQHALWINPRDGRHMLLGTDGGTYVTYDRMATWDHLNHVAIGQFYHVGLDTRPVYRVYGGLQDNGSWGGPTNTRSSTGPVNQDWISVGGGDGFVCRVDPNDPDLIYFESQNGAFGRRHLRTGETASLRPRPPEGVRYRFNWNSPFILSHHNSRIYYNAGNYVFRSLDRGNDLRPISPEITRTDRGSATALSESPRNPNVLWVGTDDGYVWVTRDGGKEWVNVTKNIGLPKHFHVASLEASRFEEGRCYVVFDAHRSDDDDPYVYVTHDFGRTWKSLRANLPWGSTRVLREDLQNRNLLYLGTEFGAWASLNAGESWIRINNNLPTVAVHEFALHPTAGEMVAATHGRSLWVMDVTPLRQLTDEVMKSKAHLFEPKTVYRWRPEPRRGGTNRQFVGANPPTGAQIYYLLAGKADKISLRILDYTGKTISELRPQNEPGLHQVTWNLTMPRGTGTAAGSTAGRGGIASSRSAGPAGQPVPPGMYRVVLRVDSKEFSQGLRIEGDVLPNQPLLADDPEEDAEQVTDY